MFEYEAQVLKIIDGDTMLLQLDLGFNVHIIETVRLARINTPEHGKWSVDGLIDPARNYIEKELPIGSVCIAQISRKEKYGRWLADILFMPGVKDRNEILESSRNLNDELVREGLAKRYDGGKK